ncbi:MAG: hypothetical protein AAF731_07705 [Bacteroidota bacterium]
MSGSDYDPWNGICANADRIDDLEKRVRELELFNTRSELRRHDRKYKLYSFVAVIVIILIVLYLFRDLIF